MLIRTDENDRREIFGHRFLEESSHGNWDPQGKSTLSLSKSPRDAFPERLTLKSITGKSPHERLNSLNSLECLITDQNERYAFDLLLDELGHAEPELLEDYWARREKPILAGIA